LALTKQWILEHGWFKFKSRMKRRLQEGLARALSALGIAILISGVRCVAQPSNYFRIQVVDAATDRGVPLVKLTTTGNVRYYTDNNGLVAFFEPGLMYRRVFFSVQSSGYEFPKDGFGFAGKALDVQPGGSATLKLKRINIAERLYRVTGEGCYRDSVLLGEKPPVRRPLLNAQVMGQDSVQAARYRGKIFWFWGDTTRSGYPLGNFHSSGATSELPGHGGLDPSVGVDLTYFTNRDGFCKPMAPMTDPGMVWLDGLLTVRDKTGRERLLAHYSRMKSLGERLEHGLVIWNDKKEQFEKLVQFDNSDDWRCPQNHPVRVHADGRDYFYFLWPDRAVRAPADLADLKNPSAYQAFTCLQIDSADGDSVTNVQRNAVGRLVWFWQTNLPPMSAGEERQLIHAGKMSEAEARFQLRDMDSGKVITIHTGTVYWNAFRKKWIMIGVQVGGTSYLGEVWYAEADSPVGPWKWAKKIATHDHYSFYGPAQHPFFDQDGGRLIYFEGSYASTFSGNNHPTPRYDYNQMMYRLDLADPRLRSVQTGRQ
jgi:hypothetical protein